MQQFLLFFIILIQNSPTKGKEIESTPTNKRATTKRKLVNEEEAEKLGKDLNTPQKFNICFSQGSDLVENNINLSILHRNK